MKRVFQTPLFLSEIEHSLKQVNAHTLIDATFGEGGHGFYFAKHGVKVLGIEWDKSMYSHAQEKVQEEQFGNRVTLYNGNFANIEEIAHKHGFVPVDAIIFDLGLSMRQIAVSGRGFTYTKTEPLDMRVSSRLQTTAAAIIKTLSKPQLYELLSQCVEDAEIGRVVDTIVRERTIKPIETTSDLVEAISKIGLPHSAHRNLVRKVLQGLRMVVNDEIVNLEKGLQGAEKIVKAGGVICVITFHSLEDRVVKLFFKDRPFFTPLFEKPLLNRGAKFARGAKLRIYLKKML